MRSSARRRSRSPADLFPYAFHPAADGVVVTASFGCPTIVANQGPLIGDGESRAGIESLRKEWFDDPSVAIGAAAARQGPDDGYAIELLLRETPAGDVEARQPRHPRQHPPDRAARSTI